MKTVKSDENIHPRAPRRLVSAWRKAGRSDRKLAELRDVNHFYVSQLLWRGVEPTNPEIRKKLFLPSKPSKPRQPKPEEFPGQRRIKKKIRELHRKTTQAFKQGMSPNGTRKDDNVSRS